MKPLLQIALDVTSLDQALSILSIPRLVDTVDILEAGTVLLASEGKAAVKTIRNRYPEKLLVADFKIADAVKTIGGMYLSAGANLITVIAAADLATMEVAAKLAKEAGKQVQIELYGRWDMDMAKAWRQAGIEHIIYHHARDASKAWGDDDLAKIKDLIALGYLVSVTGGLDPSSVALFKGLDLYSFIVGRSLYDAADPVVVAQAFQDQLKRCFPN